MIGLLCFVLAVLASPFRSKLRLACPSRTTFATVGKTTLLRTVMGLADRQAGEILIDGQPVPARAPTAMARLGITFVPDDRGVFSRLSVAENLRLARLSAYAKPSTDPLQLFPDLRTRLSQAAGTLSGGQQQQLAIARALATGPRLLIIDELSQGLQPSIVQLLSESLRTVTKENSLALVLVEQNPELAMRICDRVVVMERGEIVASGASATLRSEKSFFDLLVV
jgi:ABC-type branched-subunit amino acid transport system ATPase component